MPRKLLAALGLFVTALFVAMSIHAAVDLPFGATIDVAAPADATWNVVSRSFLDSTESKVWPGEFETVRADKLEDGATVEVVYHLGPIGDVPQSYTLVEVDSDTMTLRYRTSPSHPLQGGATVRVKEQGERSRIVWSGHYDVGMSPRSQISALLTRWGFLAPFFDQLSRNLQQWAAERKAAPNE